jgi:predicted ATP-dependent endonuclease of OLD family
MLITLKKVEIYKYKSIQKHQAIEIDPAVTTLVGMNESGKTNFLEALAKTNYFNDADKDFKFDVTQDYPRSELIEFQSSGDAGKIISCEYAISEELLGLIAADVGQGVFTAKTFSWTQYYDGTSNVLGITANEKKFLENKIEGSTLSKATRASIRKLSRLSDVAGIEKVEGDTDLDKIKSAIKPIVEQSAKTSWSNIPLAYHIYLKHIRPRLPKFWYFDDYYALPGKIKIGELKGEVSDERLKTAKAFFEMAGIKPDEILNTDDYEHFIALLEASANKITKDIFKYWSTNRNLDIDFKIQEIKNAQGQPEKHLDIRVKSLRHKVSLPLDRRSKGFNWFFSFIVWFSKIQADTDSDFVLLLDEPGLNLHASAQADLLKFINDLSDKYQIIYTTHSPFMVEPERLYRVRTCLETDEGTIISETIQEKDPNTLFPLQAALGYDIAQNLFISKNNLLVEGPADLVYLTVLSSILEADKRVGLDDSITIVPVGGLDKVSSFISLLRGQKLNVGCLLDTFTDPKGKQKVEDLVRHKIIRAGNIRFFNEFANTGKAVADIEDMFDKSEYLDLFNKAFVGDHPEVKLTDLDPSIDTIVKQINKAIGKDRFNHYRPANKLSQLGLDKTAFAIATLDNFEKMFIEINKIFKKA